MTYENQKKIVEALIFASDEPVSDQKIAGFVDDLTPKQVEAIVDVLNQEYATTHRTFFITRVAGGYQFHAHKEFAPWIKKLYKGRRRPRLSQASLETLAIVAFKQPVTKVEIDNIRGVNSSGVIKSLLERNLIVISGRAESVGKPLLYNVTPEFLKYFGLNSIADLPKPQEIEELLGQREEDTEVPEEIVEMLTQLEASEQNHDGHAPE